NGYVDRAFAVEFQSELSKEWTLADSAGNLHKVYYNKDILSPQILDGWSTLSSIYGFKGNHFILFRYASQSFFKIIVFMGEICEIGDLRGGLAEYLRQTRFKYVMLHGPVHDVKCKVLRARFPCTNIKLGRGWKIFCSLHSFREDDKIIFECHMMMSLSNIRVLQVKICHYKRQTTLYN
ncbi:hypothetical protein PHAVU_010G055000, partial [Phaseolus vulgaris]